MDVKCPKCGTTVPYVAEFAGREVFCLGCGSHFVTPDLGPQPAETTTTFRVVTFKPDDVPLTGQE